MMTLLWIGSLAFAAVMGAGAISACMLSSQISRAEEEVAQLGQLYDANQERQRQLDEYAAMLDDQAS